ncbi:bacterial dynamin-like protein isoform X2 [Ruditapes philippinarum]|uniref:bacterial dynamin-like protein isoform X2 n=1 Tax=Ruditapes philippinarum TaxID=129788 RepID=UPI00295BC3D2|nr:bacterial dynamin-like protein isoform X2 [Ruditapes philippinarum]
MTEEGIGGKQFAVTDAKNEDEKTQIKTEINSTLTLEAIDKLKDAISAMELAEDHDINIDELDSVDEIQTRLKCHVKLINEGNLKHKMDDQLKELGEKDILKRQSLSRIIEEVKNIFAQGTNSSATKRQELMEDLLNKDGTTDDITHDCDLRLTSLKEKECVILVSGESSAGKSSLLNLLLGEEILPSHMLPCTSCITVIRYHSYKCAKVVYKNGEVESIPNLDKEGLQRLQQRAYFSNAKNGTDEQGVYKRRKEGHEVAEIQVYLPITMLHSGLVFVDTPGIGENEFLENYLMEYIRSHQILGFVYIIMTDNALGIAEDRLVNLMSLIIKSQRSSNDVVKFNPKAALFVCNRWDMVPQESKKAVRENALKQLEKAWPDFDSSHAVFFSTFKAKQEIGVNKGYVTEEYVALMYGLM